MDKTEMTIETYNKHVDSYENKFMDFDSYKKRIQAFCEILEPETSILDIGCGPGNVEKLLIKSGKEFEILGIDLSNEMINRAQANVISTSVNFKVADVRKMDLEKNSFDAVIASFCLPHLTNEEAEKLIEDISRVLRDSGLLYLSCMEGNKSGFEATSFSSNDLIFFNYYSEEFIRRVLFKNGLEIIDLQRDVYLENDGSKTIDMFFFAQKNCRAVDGV